VRYSCKRLIGLIDETEWTALDVDVKTAACEWLKSQTKGGALDRDVAKRTRTATYFGQDLVDRPRRMALMNLYLHNIEPQIALGDAIYEPPAASTWC
jgi:type I restriction enzyme M protein